MPTLHAEVQLLLTAKVEVQILSSLLIRTCVHVRKGTARLSLSANKEQPFLLLNGDSGRHHACMQMCMPQIACDC